MNQELGTSEMMEQFEQTRDVMGRLDTDKKIYS